MKILFVGKSIVSAWWLSWLKNIDHFSLKPQSLRDEIQPVYAHVYYRCTEPIFGNVIMLIKLPLHNPWWLLHYNFLIVATECINLEPCSINHFYILHSLVLLHIILPNITPCWTSLALPCKVNLFRIIRGWKKKQILYHITGTADHYFADHCLHFFFNQENISHAAGIYTQCFLSMC